jgi:2-(1,2-epoxy-1,2-dihydrophenyl)acetyl-CoA isomerase
MSETVTYSLSHQVATVTLNKPEVRNALDPETLALMKDAFIRAGEDPDVRVVVLNGNGDGFCSGADLSATTSLLPASQLIEEHYKPCFMTLAELEKPVIGSINGAAAGGGCALALLCDLVVMAEDAYLLLAFSNIGLVPDCGANWLLPRAIGYQRAYQVAIEGGRLPAEDCLALGIANKVVAAAQLVSTTETWARKLATRAPLSMGLTKKLMRASFTQSYGDIFSSEGHVQDTCMASADFAEGLGAFFEKRPAVFKGQ